MIILIQPKSPDLHFVHWFDKRTISVRLGTQILVLRFAPEAFRFALSGALSRIPVRCFALTKYVRASSFLAYRRARVVGRGGPMVLLRE